MFKALSDPARLQTLIILAAGERNVGELAQAEHDRVGTVSARLKVLLQARLKLVENAVAHAGEH